MREDLLEKNNKKMESSPLDATETSTAPLSHSTDEHSTDERVRKVSALKKTLSRPELGSVSGALLVLLFFALVAGDSGMFNADGILNWTTVSAQLGILAIGACLLMISGEFDLSIGSMIGFAGMMIAIPATYWGWPVWLSILFAMTGAMAIGALIGYTVVKTDFRRSLSLWRFCLFSVVLRLPCPY